ncbi:3-phosphonopyruvate decarboxylase [Paenibacillus sp. IHBB 10380]|nr:3-phosphonopyruvate decarboxylase [Paenibacillus sp. IHBB 10380]
MNTRQFGNELKKLGFDFYSGVPCSFLKDLINYAINNCDYVMAANEGDAVAICAGAHIGGRKSVFLCQNSGLTNATSPLTSLNYTFRIPVLGFVSLRGEEGLDDEPQHELMGQITSEMLDIMKIDWEYLSNNQEEAFEQLKRANIKIEQKKSFFFIVRKNIFVKEKLDEQKLKKVGCERELLKKAEDSLPKRMEVLEKISKLTDSNMINIATTGLTGRELYEIEDLPNNLYMVGSMGCVSSLALGLAMTLEQKNIIAIDGDGAFLMRMGSIATNACYYPKNLFHLLLDNGSHESTGGQRTVSNNVDFVSLAANVGYENSIYLHSIDELEIELMKWKEKKGLTFAYLKTSNGVKENLGRPKLKPYEVKERLMNFLRGEVND